MAEKNKPGLQPILECNVQEIPPVIVVTGAIIEDLRIQQEPPRRLRRLIDTVHPTQTPRIDTWYHFLQMATTDFQVSTKTLSFVKGDPAAESLVDVSRIRVWGEPAPEEQKVTESIAPFDLKPILARIKEEELFTGRHAKKDLDILKLLGSVTLHESVITVPMLAKVFFSDLKTGNPNHIVLERIEEINKRIMPMGIQILSYDHLDGKPPRYAVVPAFIMDIDLSEVQDQESAEENREVKVKKKHKKRSPKKSKEISA